LSARIVDKLGDDVDACAAHPLGGRWGERLCDEVAQPLVLGAVEADQLFADAVPDRAGRDALYHEADAPRYDEPGGTSREVRPSGGPRCAGT
jgi:hypothetical protein